MSDEQMIADGWRRCAVGQRTTQQCGLAEEARAQERARIRAAIEALWAAYGKQCSSSGWNTYPRGAVDALANALHAIDEEDTRHE